MKALLIGMLLASPPVAAWMWRGSEVTLQTTEIQSIAETSATAQVQIPVEIVATGSTSEWVYVEVPNQAVPEPGVPALIALASLLLLRRQRPGGK